jgi:hypothetical protein
LDNDLLRASEAPLTSDLPSTIDGQCRKTITWRFIVLDWWIGERNARIRGQWGRYEEYISTHGVSPD